MSSVSIDERNIASRFLIKALESPASLAIAHNNLQLSYEDLLKATGALAAVIEAKRPRTAAIIIERGVNVPIAMLACLVSGAPFVVIDPSYPKQRVIDILTISGADVILRSNEDRASNYSASDWDRFDVIDVAHCELLRESPSDIRCQYNEVAYFIFTSGTTGFPKGIRTGHSPLLHFIDWYVREFRPKPGSRFSMMSGLSHDPVLRDVFVPLSIGAELFIPNQPDIVSPDRLFAWMKASGIEYCHTTPQLIDVLSSCRTRESKLSELRYVFCGGDVLRSATVGRVRALAPQCKLINFYGTSETPQAMTFHVVGDASASIPLGRPIDDVAIRILDDDNNQTGVGDLGQIAIETEYLSYGYIDCLVRDEAFPEMPFVEVGDANERRRTYLTGDIGYIDRDGLLHFRGRKDDQVKIRGYRVDCADVSAAIERCDPHVSAIVLPEADKDGVSYLVAYVTGLGDELKKRLASALPTYMTPSVIVGIPSLPLLANGKVDRNALRQLGREAISRNSVDRFDNELLDNVAALLKSVPFDSNASLVELGADSLSYISVELEIENYLGYLPDQWDHMAFRQIAELRRRKPATGGWANALIGVTSIETSLVFRAIGISLVILDHVQKAVYLAGTPVLFVVSGMSFARFLLPGILASESLTPTLRFVFKFGVIAALWQLVSSVGKRHLWLPDLILLGTVFPDPKRLQGPLWFLDVLAQNTIILSVIVLVLAFARRRLAAYWSPGNSDGDYWVCFALTLVGAALFLIQTESGIGDGPVGESTLLPFRWFWLAPLGATIQLAESLAKKIAPLPALFALYGLCVVGGVSGANGVNVVGGALVPSVCLLMAFKRVPALRIGHNIIVTLARNSLFLYLFCVWAPNRLTPALAKLGAPDNAIIRTVVVLTLGISCSVLWNWLYARISTLSFRTSSRERGIGAPALDESVVPPI